MKNKNFFKNILNIIGKKDGFILNKSISFNNEKKYKIIKTHKNNVKLLHFTNKKIFRKYSKSINGIEKIFSEYQGLVWYCNKIKLYY